MLRIVFSPGRVKFESLHPTAKGFCVPALDELLRAPWAATFPENTELPWFLSSSPQENFRSATQREGHPPQEESCIAKVIDKQNSYRQEKASSA